MSGPGASNVRPPRTSLRILPFVHRVRTLVPLHAHFSARFPLCASHVTEKRGSDVRHRRLARHRHRRQHRDLQRGECAPAEAAALSRSGPVGDPVAAFPGHQHSPGLAVARPIHRHPNREPLVRRDVHLAGPERNAGGAGSTGTRGGPAHVFEPVPSAGRPAALRPPAAPGGRHTRQTGRRGPEPRILEAPVQLRSERRRPGHRPEWHHPRDGIGEEPVHGRRRPAAGLRVERRDHADRGQHQADGHLPAASTRGGRRHPQRRRELQPHGAPEAGCDDGAGAGGHQRHRGTHSRQGQARQDVHHQRRPAARSGRRRRPPGHARAARRRCAGAVDRLRQRCEPAADARQRPPEGSGDPHGARRAGGSASSGSC